MPKKTDLPSYTELAAQVVRGASQPIPFDEIMHRVHGIRPINTNSPKGTLRNALTQTRLIASDGTGNYGWVPRMMKGARVRVALTDSDLQHDPPRIEFDDDAREMLWPSFFSPAKYSDHDPIEVSLPTGETTRLPLVFLGSSHNEGHWGTTGSLEFWGWLRSEHAQPDDDLILETVDGEARRYRVDHVAASKRDDVSIHTRTVEMIEAGVQLLRSSRGRSVGAKWDMARLLLVSGYYTHPVPPRPISEMWTTLLRRAEGATTPTSDIYQIKVTLEEAHPPIWRRVVVPANWSLGALHYVLQVAMGWTNSHLHHFIFGNELKRTYYSLYIHDDDDIGTIDSSKVKLSRLVKIS